MTYEVKSLNEECGVFGIWGHPQAAQVTYFGLHRFIPSLNGTPQARMWRGYDPPA